MSGMLPAGQNGAPHFVDGKAPDAFRTIGEVAQALEIRPHVLRYWEEHFPMLRPIKRSGSRRYYRPEDVELVRTIDRLVHREGYTLRGARQFLESAVGAQRGNGHATDGGEAALALRAPVPAVENGQVGADMVARLQAIRTLLVRALDKA